MDNDRNNNQNKNSLTSSLSNMMSQLDVATSFRGPASSSASGWTASPAAGIDSSSQQSLTDFNDDAMSFKSDDSGDSEAFVMVGAGSGIAGGPNDESIDATLFAIRSKACSPEMGIVEMAAEVTECEEFIGGARSAVSSSGGGGWGGGGNNNGINRSRAAPSRAATNDLLKREGVVSNLEYL